MDIDFSLNSFLHQSNHGGKTLATDANNNY